MKCEALYLIYHSSDNANPQGPQVMVKEKSVPSLSTHRHCSIHVSCSESPLTLFYIRNECWDRGEQQVLIIFVNNSDAVYDLSEVMAF